MAEINYNIPPLIWPQASYLVCINTNFFDIVNHITFCTFIVGNILY